MRQLRITPGIGRHRAKHNTMHWLCINPGIGGHKVFNFDKKLKKFLINEFRPNKCVLDVRKPQKPISAKKN